MALAFEVENLDGIDESNKGLYVEHGEGFRLDVTGVDDAAEVKGALEHERTNHKAARDALKVSEDARKASDEARTAAEKTAAENGDHKSLYESSEAARTALQVDHDALKGNVSKDKRNAAAMKIAVTLADGVNAELLSEQIMKRLSYTDGGIKVLDAEGQPSVATLKDLTTEFKGNDRYGSLLKGNKSNGGGAGGGGNGGGASKEITRSEYSEMSPQAAAKFFKEGGRVTD